VAARPADALRDLTYEQVRQKARADADNVLASYWSTDAYPVDPVSIARALGLSVFSAQLADDVFGMVVGSAAGVDIYLDKDQPPARFRFSCAHEIGHYVLRSAELAEGKAFVDKRSDSGRGALDEVYANEFAGSLLMPEAALRAAVNERTSDFELMRRFDVSLDALKYRRLRLGF
jgi:Zn-dependent peptidase ImmA (M78 family)